MDDRKLIVNEYYKLSVLLNRSNKEPNLKTEVRFLIRSLSNQTQFVATLRGEGTTLIQLCTSELNFRWEQSGFSGLKNLEKFCADRLNYCQENGTENICESVSKELASLLAFEHKP